MTDLLDSTDFTLAETITRKNDSNLYLAAKGLPKWRYRFFLATYAAMRVIDDLVDDDFLVLPVEERNAKRDPLLLTVADWQWQCLGYEASGPLAPALVSALAATAHQSDLGPWPWNALADAMRDDTREAGMPRRERFLTYCTGATVAPATIFIYLLGATRDKAGRLSWVHPEPARTYAEDLAIYCYIVHILRDLEKDAAKSARLLTIPDDVLDECGLSRDTLADAVSGKSASIRYLAETLVSFARPYQEQGHARLASLVPMLDMRERMALAGLINIYDKLFASFEANYAPDGSVSGALERDARKQSFGEGGK